MPHLRTLVAAAALVLLQACASRQAPASTGASSGGASTPGSDQSTITAVMDAQSAPFVASRNSKKFYPASCHTVSLIKPADRIGFRSVAEAEKAGCAKDLYSTDCKY
ncbi:MAG: hypothetical protein V4617_12750 [Gemmatimonadota bacterium]